MGWAAYPLYTHYAFQLDRKNISPTQALKLSKTASTSTAIVPLEQVFTDSMQSLLTYSRSFIEKHGVRFFFVGIMDIVDDIMSSTFLAANSRATYTRYIRVHKVLIKRKYELAQLKNIGRDAPATNTLGITPLAGPSIYVSSEKCILVLTEDADLIVKTDQKRTAIDEN